MYSCAVRNLGSIRDVVDGGIVYNTELVPFNLLTDQRERLNWSEKGHRREIRVSQRAITIYEWQQRSRQDVVIWTSKLIQDVERMMRRKLGHAQFVA